MVLKIVSLERPVGRVVGPKHHLGLSSSSMLCTPVVVFVDKLVQVVTRLHTTAKGHCRLVLLSLTSCGFWDLSMLQGVIKALLEFLFLELESFPRVILVVEGV